MPKNDKFWIDLFISILLHLDDSSSEHAMQHRRQQKPPSHHPLPLQFPFPESAALPLQRRRVGPRVRITGGGKCRAHEALTGASFVPNFPQCHGRLHKQTKHRWRIVNAILVSSISKLDNIGRRFKRYVNYWQEQYFTVCDRSQKGFN